LLVNVNFYFHFTFLWRPQLVKIKEEVYEVMEMNEEKDDLEKEEEEKQFILDYMKMQNEALKRIYKNTLDKDKED
jgi:hypothetical protein